MDIKRIKLLIAVIVLLIVNENAFSQVEYNYQSAADIKVLEELGVPQKNHSDANIFGHVIDADTKEHLPFVNIIVEGTSIGVATDETGHYLLVDLPEGKHTVIAKYLGYKSQSIDVVFKAGITKELNFELHQDYLNTEGVVVTASRYEKSRKDATTVVSVMDTKMFEITQSANLAEGLNFQPGVRVENDCQNCGFTQLRMNGLDGPYTQILIDSRPVMSALSKVYGLEQIPANMVDRVEVVRGGGSVLYGSSAIAGTVNIITKEPRSNTFSLKSDVNMIDENSADINSSFNASVVTDDYNTGMFIFAQYRNRDSYNANPDDMWDRDGDGIKESKDDFSELATIKSKSFGFRAYHRFSLSDKMSVEYHHLGEFRRGGNKFDRLAHQADIAEQIESDVNGGSVEYSHISKNLKHHLSVYNSLQNVDRDTYYGAEQDPNAYGTTKEITNITGLQYIGYYNKFLFAKSTLNAGAEFKYSDLSDTKLAVDENITIADQELTNIGVYAENEWDLNKIKVKAGIRADKHSKLNDVVLSPRANILYDINSSCQLRLSYAKGFRAPQIFDEDLHIEVTGAQGVKTINDENLKEEISSSYGLSVDYSGFVGLWQSYFLVEGFYTDLDNQFVKEIQINDDGDAFLYRQNGSGASVYGVNIEGKLAPSESTSITFGFTHQKSKYDEEEVVWESTTGNADSTVATNNILRTPDNYGYIVASWKPNHHWDFSINGTYTGGMLVPHLKNVDNEYTIIENSKDFFDLGAKVSYEFHLGNKVSVTSYVGVKNILNQYQNDFDAGINRDAGYVYGPGLPRLLFFGIKMGNIL